MARRGPTYTKGATKFFDVSVLGQRDLTRAFRDLKIGVARRVVKKAMRPAFKPTMKIIAGLVPREIKKVKKLKLRFSKSKRNKNTTAMRIFTPGREALGIGPIAKPGSRGGRPTPGFFPMSWETGYTTQTGRRIPARSFMRAGLRQDRANIRSRFTANLRKYLLLEAKKVKASDQTRSAAGMLGR